MLNENIRKLRKAAGMSQEQLASQLNVVRQTVSKWEKGLSSPDARMLAALADVFDTDTDALLGDTPPQTSHRDESSDLLERVEHLENELDARRERGRKIWRVLFVLLGAAAILLLLKNILAGIWFACANKALAVSVAVIGGADGPTAIFVTGSSVNLWPVFISVLAAAGSAAGLYFTGRK